MSGEKQIFAAEEAKEQLILRARHNHFVRIALDSQEWNKWDDATTFAILACYQADTIERLSTEIVALRNLQPVRHTFSIGPHDLKSIDELEVQESKS